MIATTAEVASALGMSKAGVGHVERRAIKKLRAYCRRRGLTLGDFISETPADADEDYSISPEVGAFDTDA